MRLASSFCPNRMSCKIFPCRFVIEEKVEQFQMGGRQVLRLIKINTGLMSFVLFSKPCRHVFQASGI